MSEIEFLANVEQRDADRNEVLAQACQSGTYTMADIAEHFGVHCMAVSRAVRAFRAVCLYVKGAISGLQCSIANRSRGNEAEVLEC